MSIVLTPLVIETDPSELDEPGRFPSAPLKKKLRVPEMVGTILDLRSQFQRENTGNGPTAPGYVMANVPAGLEHRDAIVIGDDFGSLVNGGVRQTLSRELDMGNGSVIQAMTPAAIAVELLMEHADPLGVTRWGIPFPGIAGVLHIYMGGLELLRRRIDIRTDAFRGPLLARAQENYRQARAETNAGLHPPGHHRRFLQTLLWKFDTNDYEQFIASDLPIETPLTPSTIRGDTMVEAADTTLQNHTATGPNGGHDYTEINNVGGDCTVEEATDDLHASVTVSTYRADSALQTPDMYCQAIVNYGSGGSRRRWNLMTRYNPSGAGSGSNDFYQAHAEEDGAGVHELVEMTDDSDTVIASSAQDPADGDLMRLESNGTNHVIVVNGIIIAGPASDATHSTTSAGVGGRHNGTTGGLDFLEFADLGQRHSFADIDNPPAVHRQLVVRPY